MIFLQKVQNKFPLASAQQNVEQFKTSRRNLPFTILTNRAISYDLEWPWKVILSPERSPEQLSKIVACIAHYTI